MDIDRRDSFDVKPYWSAAGQRHANQVTGVRDRRAQMGAGQDGSAMGPAAAVAGAINDDVGRRAARQFGDGAAQQRRTEPLPYSVRCPDQPVRAPHFRRAENVIKAGSVICQPRPPNHASAVGNHLTSLSQREPWRRRRRRWIRVFRGRAFTYLMDAELNLGDRSQHYFSKPVSQRFDW